MQDCCNVQVFLRVRPFINRERDISAQTRTPLHSIINVNKNYASVLNPEDDYSIKDTYLFDKCFWSVDKESVTDYLDQASVYKQVGPVMLDTIFQGYNTCLFAYGQTGSGKTFTMMGDLEHKTEQGIIPRLCKELFSRISNLGTQNGFLSFKAEVSYLEIYNEKVRDLLGTGNSLDELKCLRIRQHPVSGPFVDGLSSYTVTNYSAILSLMTRGAAMRATAHTRLNDHSSRSHAIFIISFQQLMLVEEEGAEAGSSMHTRSRTSKINLVDLAGSERTKISGVEGLNLKEANAINKSLTALGRVIDILVEISTQKQRKGKSKQIPPYRDSHLTWILSESLGGNSKTIMIATVSPFSGNFDETISTLRYSSRARHIVNAAMVNEDSTVKMVHELRNKNEKLTREVARLAVREKELVKENAELKRRLGIDPTSEIVTGSPQTPSSGRRSTQNNTNVNMEHELSKLQHKHSTEIKVMQSEHANELTTLQQKNHEYKKRYHAMQEKLESLNVILQSAGISAGDETRRSRHSDQSKSSSLNSLRSFIDENQRMKMELQQVKGEFIDQQTTHERLQHQWHKEKAGLLHKEDSTSRKEMEEVMELRRCKNTLQEKMKEVEQKLRKSKAESNVLFTETASKDSKIETLENKIRSLQSELENITKKSLQQKQWMDNEMDSKLTEKNALYESMQQQYTEIKLKNTKLEDEIGHQAKKNVRLQQAVDKQKLDIHEAQLKLAEQARQSQSKLQELERGKQESKQEIQSRLAKEQHWEAERHKMNTHIEELRQRFAEKDEKYQEARIRAKRNKAAGQELMTRNEALTKKNTVFEQQIVELNAKLSNASRLEEQLSTALNDQKAVEKQYINAKEEMKLYKRRLEEATETISKMDPKLQQLTQQHQQELQKLQNKHNQRITVIQQEMKQAEHKQKESSEDYREKLERTQNTVRDLTMQLQTTQKSLQSANSKLQDADPKVAKMLKEHMEEILVVKGQLDDSISAERRLKHENETLQQQCKRLEADMQARGQQAEKITELQDNIEHLVHENQGLDTRLEQALSLLQEKSEMEQNLASGKQSVTERCDLLQGELQAAQREIRDKNDEIESLQMSNQQWAKEQSTQHEHTVATLKKEMADMKEEADELRHLIRTLRHQAELGKEILEEEKQTVLHQYKREAKTAKRLKQDVSQTQALFSRVQSENMKIKQEKERAISQCIETAETYQQLDGLLQMVVTNVQKGEEREKDEDDDASDIECFDKRSTTSLNTPRELLPTTTTSSSNGHHRPLPLPTLSPLGIPNSSDPFYSVPSQPGEYLLRRFSADTCSDVSDANDVGFGLDNDAFVEAVDVELEEVEEGEVVEGDDDSSSGSSSSSSALSSDSD